MSLATTALAQTPSFWHAGADLLRSKSLDRNSYDSGDWFNRLDWTGADNGFGHGLPPEADNGAKWPYMKPLLANAGAQAGGRPTCRPPRPRPRSCCGCGTPRRCSGWVGAGHQAKVGFPVSGTADAHPGVVVMRVDDTVGRDADPALKGLVVVFNASPATVTQQVPGMAGAGLALSPVQAGGRRPGGQGLPVGCGRGHADRAGAHGGGLRPALIARAARPARAAGGAWRGPGVSVGGGRPAAGRGRPRPAWRRGCPRRRGGSAAAPPRARRAARPAAPGSPAPGGRTGRRPHATRPATGPGPRARRRPGRRSAAGSRGPARPAPRRRRRRRPARRPPRGRPGRAGGPDPCATRALTAVLDHADGGEPAQVVARGAAVGLQPRGQGGGGRGAVLAQLGQEPGAQGVGQHPQGRTVQAQPRRGGGDVGHGCTLCVHTSFAQTPSRRPGIGRFVLRRALRRGILWSRGAPVSLGVVVRMAAEWSRTRLGREDAPPPSQRHHERTKADPCARTPPSPAR